MSGDQGSSPGELICECGKEVWTSDENREESGRIERNREGAEAVIGLTFINFHRAVEQWAKPE